MYAIRSYYAEQHPAVRNLRLGSRVDHRRSLEPFLQKADAPVVLAQLALGVVVVGVFAAVTVTRRPGSGLDHLGAQGIEQFLELGAQALLRITSYNVCYTKLLRDES